MHNALWWSKRLKITKVQHWECNLWRAAMLGMRGNHNVNIVLLHRLDSQLMIMTGPTKQISADIGRGYECPDWTGWTTAFSLIIKAIAITNTGSYSFIILENDRKFVSLKIRYRRWTRRWWPHWICDMCCLCWAERYCFVSWVTAYFISSPAGRRGIPTRHTQCAQNNILFVKGVKFDVLQCLNAPFSIDPRRHWKCLQALNVRDHSTWHLCICIIKTSNHCIVFLCVLVLNLSVVILKVVIVSNDAKVAKVGFSILGCDLFRKRTFFGSAIYVHVYLSK